MRGDHATEPYAKAMRKRQGWVTTQRVPGFAEAKAWHGLRRFRLRGLEQGNGEAQLIAAGQNVKRLRGWRGWGRRPFSSGTPGSSSRSSGPRWRRSLPVRAAVTCVPAAPR